MPRIAARLNLEQVSGITRVVSADTFKRPICAGSAIATVQCADPVKVITVRTTGFEAPSRSGLATVETIVPVGDAGTSVFVSRELAQSSPKNLTKSKQQRLDALRY